MLHYALPQPAPMPVTCSPALAASAVEASDAFYFDGADGEGGDGDADWEGCTLEFSTYGRGDLDDDYIKVAASHMGQIVTDVVAVIDEDLFRRPSVKRVLRDLNETNQAGRLKRLAGISKKVIRWGDEGRGESSGGFQILRLRPESGVVSDVTHARRYSFFHEGIVPMAFVHTCFADGLEGRMFKHIIRSDITLIEGLLASTREYIRTGNSNGVATLNYAKGASISMEVWARQCDRREIRAGRQKLINGEMRMAIELLWDCFHVAQAAYANQKFDREVFDACYFSLLAFMRDNSSSLPL